MLARHPVYPFIDHDLHSPDLIGDFLAIGIYYAPSIVNRDIVDSIHGGLYIVSMARKQKNPAAVTLGRLGGKARAKKLSPERRREIARKAIETRWARQKFAKKGPPSTSSSH